MRKLRTGVRDKRKRINSIVTPLIKGVNIPKVMWAKDFYNELMVGYLVLREDGNIVSLYTPRGHKTPRCFPSLRDNSVDIHLYKEEYSPLVSSISEALQKAGYETSIKLMR